jgi:hypothetical protein
MIQDVISILGLRDPRVCQGSSGETQHLLPLSLVLVFSFSKMLRTFPCRMLGSRHWRNRPFLQNRSRLASVNMPRRDSLVRVIASKSIASACCLGMTGAGIFFNGLEISESDFSLS